MILEEFMSTTVNIQSRKTLPRRYHHYLEVLARHLKGAPLRHQPQAPLPFQAEAAVQCRLNLRVE